MRKFNVTVNGNTYEVDVEEVGTSTVQQAPVQKVETAAAKPQPAAPAPVVKPQTQAGGKSVVSPMPGTIVSVKVSVGDKVTKDTVVAVLEAMKMENEIFAGADGVVASVGTSVGASVNTGDMIVSLN